MAEYDSASLIGHWVHSHEEDRAGQSVFRKAGFAFPRARGRAGFDLEPNHVWVDRPIAPGDGNLRISGQWELNASGELCLRKSGPQGVTRSFRLVEVQPDRMVVEEMPQLAG